LQLDQTLHVADILGLQAERRVYPVFGNFHQFVA